MGAAAAGLLGAIDKHTTNALDKKYSGKLQNISTSYSHFLNTVSEFL